MFFLISLQYFWKICFAKNTFTLSKRLDLGEFGGLKPEPDSRQEGETDEEQTWEIMACSVV